MPLAPGAIIGRYEVRSLLGQGGMGEVYRAFDTSLGRDVALKVLDAAVAVDPERVHRFLQEARAASALNHPNIIAIYEAGESASTRFIASELVEGRTLRELLAGGPLPLAQALDIASQVASALAAAHAAGIVHRDIKPENIMVRPDGYAKVLDFGLAKLTDSSASGAHTTPDAAATMLQTTAGVVMGTVAYMSPEQARALKVDVRTDCYSLGAVIFEMITGRQPFTGATGTDVMVAILERDAPLDVLRREGLPAQLVWVVAKALDKNPDLRHQNAADLRVDLDRIRRDIATGAVYADADAQLDRPSAILREVADTDVDAIAMYGWSRAMLAAVILGVISLLALPFAYRATLGVEQKAGVPAAAAEIRARDIAAALGRPVDGRTADAELGTREGLHLHDVATAGEDALRQFVREGGAAEWRVTFNAEQTAEQHGTVNVRLTPDGRLRAFQGSQRRTPPAVTISFDEAAARATAALKQHLGADAAAYTPVHGWRTSDSTAYDFEWKSPSPVHGHTETLHAVLDDAGFRTLARRLEAPPDPPVTGFINAFGQFKGAAMVIATAVAYVLGILVLVRTRRWSMVGRRLPIAMSLGLALGFLVGVATQEGSIVGMIALVAVSALMAGGALPAVAGVIAWLKQVSAVRLHGAEQLTGAQFRSPAVAASLLAGLGAACVIALLMTAYEAAGLNVAGYRPSVSQELGLARSNFFLSQGGWVSAAFGIALGIAILYEIPGRLTKRPLALIALIPIVAGLLSGNPSAGLPMFLLTGATAMLVVTVLLAVYGRVGLAAVLIAALLWPVAEAYVPARSVGGSEASSSATMMLMVLGLVAALAIWSYAGARMKAGVDTLSSKSGIR